MNQPIGGSRIALVPHKETGAVQSGLNQEQVLKVIVQQEHQRPVSNQPNRVQINQTN